MNLAALIGSVVSVRGEGTEVMVEMSVAGRGGRNETLRVLLDGAVASSCSARLQPGDRIAVEGVVHAGGQKSADVTAERVQYLTSHGSDR